MSTLFNTSTLHWREGSREIQGLGQRWLQLWEEKPCGANGVQIPHLLHTSKYSVPGSHDLEYMSKLCAMALPNASVPSCPIPSFSTQFMAPAAGMAPAPKPTE